MRRLLAPLALLLTTAAMPAQAWEPRLQGDLLAGMAVLDRNVSAGAARLIDQGGDLPLAGLRLGAGARHPSGLLLRAEGEGWLADGRSRVNTAGVLDSLTLEGGVGGYGVVGVETRAGAQAFVRAGVQGWQAERQRSGRATQSGWHAAPYLGLGLQVPVAGRTHLRIDAGWADAGSLDAEIWQATVSIGVRF